MPRALFVASILQFSRETWPVLERLHQGGFEVHVLVGWSGPASDEYEERARAAGFVTHRVAGRFRYGDPHGIPEQDLEPASRSLRPPRSRVRGNVGATAYAALAFVRLLRQFVATRHFARALISDVQPALVLGGPYQSCGTFDDAIARVVATRSIPYACLSIRPYIGERAEVDTRVAQAQLGRYPPSLFVSFSWTNRLLARLFPSWTRPAGTSRIFIFEPVRMLAARLTGLLDSNPWSNPSPLYDCCFVESENSLRLLQSSGYPVDKVVVAGKPLLDDVFGRLDDEEHIESLYRALGLAPGAPFVLFNVEPTAEHFASTWEEHWARFNMQMRAMQSAGKDVVLSLHPLCRLSHYEFVERDYGFRIARDHKIVELFPYCDLVVSFPCSTNPLAPIFDKPLLVYDFVGQMAEGSQMDDLYDVPGSTIVRDAGELATAVARMAQTTRPNSKPVHRPVPAADVVYRTIRERFAL